MSCGPALLVMKNQKTILLILLLLFAVMMSVPYLVPHTGVLALFGLVPLLCMERIATLSGIKKIWIWHYGAFLLWNAFTTFWVCNATVGGGIFACLANAFQMSLVFGVFRWSRRTFKGALPYILLALLWIAWEKYYLTVAQISWPWLVLGNSFARTVSLAQWYEYLGTLGGSAWIWACNLGLFGIMVSLSDGRWFSFNAKAKVAAVGGWLCVLIAPMVFSLSLYRGHEETDRPLNVIALQPNIDPYHKFQALSQNQQNVILLDQLTKALKGADTTAPILAVAPETFTGDVLTNNLSASRTYRRFQDFLRGYPNVSLLFGASAHSIIESQAAPSNTARKLGEGRWIESHNSALMIDGNDDDSAIYHKSKLVVGVEMTPYPGFFCKVDDLLGGVMGRCIGQDEVSTLDLVARDSTGRITTKIPIGCAICYESVYPEHCAEYANAGAEVLAIITNDAWWGDTPGYRQHLSYASLRAIETRRDIVRSANTGISAIINQRGDILSQTHWWEKETLSGTVNLNSSKTFFATQGDIVGRLSVFLSALLLLSAFVRLKSRNE